MVAADCQVLEAVLSFLHQDWSSYMRGAWVLRKAWKVYQKTYGHIRRLYMKEVGLRENSIGERAGKKNKIWHVCGFFYAVRTCHLTTVNNIRVFC